eukprot:CAMPEP_0115024688 /NCGR_PEP_ID=MMETSP0216-20121206/33437_1 /TAXON_ID=223996 /ORGANISM="Protocruzia adherens, Strain Boccale" /LENGTH=511 /DNA_ID=CAMNT_0002398895 /DNA_START=60 /DNA_END=1592 /DNA_ORIENTATION=-
MSFARQNRLSGHQSRNSKNTLSKSNALKSSKLPRSTGANSKRRLPKVLRESTPSTGTMDSFSSSLFSDPPDMFDGCILQPMEYSPGIPAGSKVILLLGEVASGKTTLMNTIVNFHAGVKRSSDVRYYIGNDPRSPTEKINIMSLKPNELAPSGLTFVDTPGFGGNGGKNGDRALLEMISNFLRTEVNRIDMVCLVMHASLPRLTPTQMYILNNVVSIFGKEMAKNIALTLTHADAAKSTTLPALRKFGFTDNKVYKINSSAMFVSDETASHLVSSTTVNVKLWKMNAKYLTNWFEDLKRSFHPRLVLLTGADFCKKSDLQRRRREIRDLLVKQVEDIQSKKDVESAISQVKGELQRLEGPGIGIYVQASTRRVPLRYARCRSCDPICWKERLENQSRRLPWQDYFTNPCECGHAWENHEDGLIFDCEFLSGKEHAQKYHQKKSTLQKHQEEVRFTEKKIRTQQSRILSHLEEVNSIIQTLKENAMISPAGGVIEFLDEFDLDQDLSDRDGW